MGGHVRTPACTCADVGGYGDTEKHILRHACTYTQCHNTGLGTLLHSQNGDYQGVGGGCFVVVGVDLAAGLAGCRMALLYPQQIYIEPLP
jgi:hypothetical protein